MATKLQLQLLNHIARSEFTQYNGARPDEPVEAWLFIDEVASDLNITVNQAKGVVGSATEADLIGVSAYDKEMTEISMTQKGFDVWKQEYPE